MNDVGISVFAFTSFERYCELFSRHAMSTASDTFNTQHEIVT